MNFCSKLTKADLIIELRKRSLSTDGAKADLISRFRDAKLQEDLNEIYREEENYDYEYENIQDFNNKGEMKNKAISKKCRASKSFLTDIDDMTSVSPEYENIHHKEPIKKPKDIHKSKKEVIVIEDDENANSRKTSTTTRKVKEPENNTQREDDEDASEKGRNIVWVYKVAKNVKAVELKDLLEKYGKVLSVKIVMNGKSPSGNCFGCIQLSSSADVKNCIKHLNKTEFRGSIISVTKNIYDITHADLLGGTNTPTSSIDSGPGNRGKRKQSSSEKSETPFMAVSQVTKVDNKQPRVKYGASVPNRGTNNYQRGYNRINYNRDYRGRDYQAPGNGRYGEDQGRFTDDRSEGGYQRRVVYEPRYEPVVGRDRREQRRDDEYGDYNRSRGYGDEGRYGENYERGNYRRPYTDYTMAAKRAKPDLDGAGLSRRPGEYRREGVKRAPGRVDQRDYRCVHPPHRDNDFARSSLEVYTRNKGTSYYSKDSYHFSADNRPRNY